MIGREVVEGRQVQGADEQVAYRLTCPSDQTPATPSFKLYDVATDGSRTDVSSTKLSGAGSVSGQVITSPLVISLVDGHLYRLQVTYTSSGNTFSAYVLIDAEF